jgi:hypothetical protein
MKFGLRFLNDYAYDTHENTYLNLPEIFDDRDPIVTQILPYRSFIARYDGSLTFVQEKSIFNFLSL